MTRMIILDGKTPFGVSIRDEAGETLPAFSVELSVRPNEIVRATVELAVDHIESVAAEATCYFRGRKVSRIVFEDGGEEEF